MLGRMALRLSLRASVMTIVLTATACKSSQSSQSCPIQGSSGPSAGAPTKIMQLLGDLDLESTPPTPTRSQTVTTIGLLGTDLGFSFMHKGKLWFMFGDTIPRDPSPQRIENADSIAWTDDFVDAGPNPNGDLGFDIHFLTEPDDVDPTKTEFQPVRLDGRELGTLDLPTTGFSDGTTMYVFFI